MDQYRYRASAAGATLPVTAQGDATLCVALPQRQFAAGVRDDSPERYLVVRIDNGVAPGPLLAHLYDLGAQGFHLVGLERPNGAQ